MKFRAVRVLFFWYSHIVKVKTHNIEFMLAMDSKELAVSNNNELIELINSSYLLSLLDFLHVNFSLIASDGNYIVQNNTIIEDFTKNKTKAQEIDMVSWRDCEKTMRLGKRRMVEEEYKGKYYFSIKQPLNVNGQCRGIVVMSMDITARKLTEQREKEALAKAEEQKAKTAAEETLRRSITIFAGSIAHDLRVPLASISIMTDLFSRSLAQLDKEHNNSEIHLEQLKAFPAKLKKSVHEMNSFIDVTLKSMQRLATGALGYEDFSVCEIEQCMQDVLSRYPFVNEEKNLIHIEKLDNFYFLACPILFYRILFNLINNALEQIAKNKKGNIYLSAECGKKENVFRIKDTAGGAPSKIVKRLFDGYRTTKKNGTGVGLAFCKLTMQSFGGDITCHSVEGDYIEFELSFPVLENAETALI